MDSYEKAIAIARTFDVLGSSSPLSRKLNLEKESDWIDFINKSGAVSGNGGDGNTVSINLEKFLRHCFDIAFKMPPSPTSKTHARSASEQIFPPRPPSHARTGSENVPAPPF